MIIWSIVPPDILFNTSEHSPSYEEIKYNGLTCLVEKISSTQCKIIRLITTNPNDYLQTELQPGEILTYEPNIKALS